MILDKETIDMVYNNTLYTRRTSGDNYFWFKGVEMLSTGISNVLESFYHKNNLKNE